MTNEYFNDAKVCGDKLVIVKSDNQCAFKGTKSLKEKLKGFSLFHISVDEVIISIDQVWKQCKTLKRLLSKLNDSYHLGFADGGDQNNMSMPEASVCKELMIELIEVLGNKTQSSSWLLKK
jgi:hypothetical protein